MDTMNNVIKPRSGQVTIINPHQVKPEPKVCDYLGEVVGTGKCGCAVPPNVHNCKKLNGWCVLKPKIIRSINMADGTTVVTNPKQVTFCDNCKYRTCDRLVYTKTTDLVTDTYKLVKYVPPDCQAIIGIPRSGMLPAAILATHLQLPLRTTESVTAILKCWHLAAGAPSRTMAARCSLLMIVAMAVTP
jgi:hypothetical protein